jgi:hypothetical protein
MTPIHSPAGGVVDRNERRRHSWLSLEGPISPYAVLGATVSSENWSSGGEHSHLVFSGRREAAARDHGGSSLPCSAPFDDDGASVHFQPKGGAGWNQGAQVVLLDPKVELGWPGFALATAAATKVSGGMFWELQGGHRGEAFLGQTPGVIRRGSTRNSISNSQFRLRFFKWGSILVGFNLKSTLLRLRRGYVLSIGSI